MGSWTEQKTSRENDGWVSRCEPQKRYWHRIDVLKLGVDWLNASRSKSKHRSKRRLDSSVELERFVARMTSIQEFVFVRLTNWIYATYERCSWKEWCSVEPSTGNLSGICESKPRSSVLALALLVRIQNLTLIFLKFTSRKTPIFAEFSKSMEELFDVASPGSKTDSG